MISHLLKNQARGLGPIEKKNIKHKTKNKKCWKHADYIFIHEIIVPLVIGVCHNYESLSMV